MPQDAERLLERAHAHIRHHNLRGAIESLREALSLDASNAHAHALLAICLHDERRLYAADHEARAALALDADSGFVHYAMAIVALAQRRFALAEQHLRQALALEPDNAAFLRALARLYALWNRPAQALPLLEKARELEPDDPESWAALAEHQRESRDFALAEQFARRALELDPDNADALLVMGQLLLRAGRVAEAREHALLVLRQDAGHEGGIHLLSAVKARSSFLLGLWWRFNSFVAGGSLSRRVILLIGLFLVYRIASMALGDLGYSDAQLPLHLIWLGFCVYSWVGPALFAKRLQRELEPARLDPKY